MRLLRQQSPGDWSSVCTELLRLVGKWIEVRARREFDAHAKLPP
jgi:hypothetical protein